MYVMYTFGLFQGLVAFRPVLGTLKGSLPHRKPDFLGPSFEKFIQMTVVVKNKFKWRQWGIAQW